MEFVGSLFFKLEAYFLNVCRLLSGSWCSRAWLFWMAELGFDRFTLHDCVLCEKSVGSKAFLLALAVVRQPSPSQSLGEVSLRALRKSSKRTWGACVALQRELQTG